MKNKIPKSINVGGIKISVSIVKELDALGTYYPQEQRISILGDQPDDSIYSAFIHETLEAINQIYDIKLKHHQIRLIETALKSLNFTIEKN